MLDCQLHKISSLDTTLYGWPYIHRLLLYLEDKVVDGEILGLEQILH